MILRDILSENVVDYGHCLAKKLEPMKHISILFISIFSTEYVHAEQSYSVINVADDSVLNIRTDIHRVDNFTNGGVVGTIPTDADAVEGTGLSVMLNGARWREVRFAGVTGWVNSYFLARNRSTIDTIVNLSCFGVEPFWNFEIDGGTAELNTAEDEKIQFTEISKNPSQSRQNLWGYKWLGDGNSTELVGLVSEANICSDGMSDLGYAYEIFLMGTSYGKGPIQGCCSIPLE